MDRFDCDACFAIITDTEIDPISGLWRKNFNSQNASGSFETDDSRSWGETNASCRDAKLAWVPGTFIANEFWDDRVKADLRFENF